MLSTAWKKRQKWRMPSILWKNTIKKLRISKSLKCFMSIVSSLNITCNWNSHRSGFLIRLHIQIIIRVIHHFIQKHSACLQNQFQPLHLKHSFTSSYVTIRPKINNYSVWNSISRRQSVFKQALRKYEDIGETNKLNVWKTKSRVEFLLLNIKGTEISLFCLLYDYTFMSISIYKCHYYIGGLVDVDVCIKDL